MVRRGVVCVKDSGVGRAIRWQAIIAFLGILLLAALLASTAQELTSVTVPASGGIYTEAAIGAPRAINPLLAFSTDLDQELVGLVFEGLVRLDERGEAQPALAERWEISPDQRTYTFHLRRDVRWHDGAPFTAEDVLYTVNVMQSETFASPDFPVPGFLSELWRNVEATRIDDYTVQFQLQQPYAPFLYENTIGILPAHLWREVPIADMPRSLLNQQPVGTGPWRVASLNATSIRLEPNPYARGPEPYLEAIDLVFYPDYASAFAAFAAGEVDGVSRILPQDLPRAWANEEMTLLSTPLPEETLIYFNLLNPNTPFLADPQVRRALMMALDVPALIETALNGQGIPADSPIMKGTWAHSAQDMPDSDPERAAELLDAIGWEDTDRDGVRDQGEMTMSFVLLGDNEELLQAIADQWAKIGVWAKPQLVSLVSLAGDYLSPRRYEVALVHWKLAGDPDPYPLWHTTQIEGGQNYTGWSHRRADEIMEEGRSVADPGRRMELYREFQEIFAQELPALPLYYDVYSFGVHEEVRNVQVGRLNDPVDRFRTAHQWYMVTERVTVEPWEEPAR